MAARLDITGIIDSPLSHVEIFTQQHTGDTTLDISAIPSAHGTHVVATDDVLQGVSHKLHLSREFDPASEERAPGCTWPCENGDENARLLNTITYEGGCAVFKYPIGPAPLTQAIRPMTEEDPGRIPVSLNPQVLEERARHARAARPQRPSPPKEEARGVRIARSLQRTIVILFSRGGHKTFKSRLQALCVGAGDTLELGGPQETPEQVAERIRRAQLRMEARWAREDAAKAERAAAAAAAAAAAGERGDANDEDDGEVVIETEIVGAEPGLIQPSWYAIR